MNAQCWTVTLASTVLILAGCSGGARDGRPHLLLITSDTLRADHLSLHGHSRATSPSIDAFAAQSWNFTDAVTVIPKTGPSFTTLFTGQHPQVHGVRSNFDGVPAKLPVLAERLRALGYRTAAFIGSPVLRSGKGYDRGFDVFRTFDGRRGEGVVPVNHAFLEWARDEWTQPTFVWIHYMDPHGPYLPPADLAGAFLDDAIARADARVLPAEAPPAPGGISNKVLGAIPLYQILDGERRVAVYVARYDAEILGMDRAFGEVIDFLEGRDLLAESAVLFSSDHGESLGENDFWFEHGWFADEAELHVPLLIRTPGQVVGGRVERQVSNLDLLPTILALVGEPADPALTGTDLLDPSAAAAPLLIENSDQYPEKYHGIRAAPWKYLRRAGDGREMLFDLRSDPHEQRDLSAHEPERLRELRSACDEGLRAAREAAVEGTAGSPDDPATLERLKALGYVD
jgi:arylsulfatase